MVHPLSFIPFNHYKTVSLLYKWGNREMRLLGIHPNFMQRTKLEFKFTSISQSSSSPQHCSGLSWSLSWPVLVWQLFPCYWIFNSVPRNTTCVCTSQFTLTITLIGSLYQKKFLVIGCWILNQTIKVKSREEEGVYFTDGYKWGQRDFRHSWRSGIEVQRVL